MIYPGNYEDKSGFSAIKALVAERCKGPLGRRRAGDCTFSHDRDFIARLLEETVEYLDIIRNGNDRIITEYKDPESDLNHIRLPGTYLDPEVLLELHATLKMIYSLTDACTRGMYRKYVHLVNLATGVETHPDVVESIEKIVSEQGEVRDGASDKLAKIRSSIRKKAKESERTIHRIFLDSKKSGWTPPESEIVIRQGRLLIPVTAANKRKLTGYIHDESATGQTVFVEPAANFTLNNEIRDLENEERREIVRILIAFADSVRPVIEDMLMACNFLGTVDFTRAKALLADKIDATKPVLAEGPAINWEKSRHPLLYLKNRELKKDTVPLDISLSRDKRILIISGPNAGGKSVCLKTVALLQYMLQCGFLIPVKEGSTGGVFEKLFLEIGDEQSIDQDLSTYSSHLTHVREILIHADQNTLFMIDEFGAGTDPQLGGSLAEAALEFLVEKGPLGIVTTHYSNLKLLPDRFDSVVNGAMLYDADKMLPLFKLIIGKPGSSFAFDIARNIGLPEEIIDAATGKTGKTQLDFEKQLQELEKEKEEMQTKKTEFNVADTFLDETIRKYESLLEKLEASKSEILSKAHNEAEEVLKNANRLIENTIKEIRNAEADKEKTKVARRKLEGEKEKIRTQRKRIEPEKEQIENKRVDEINPGDWVKLKGQQAEGEVIEIGRNNVVIDLNGIQFKTSPDKVEKSDGRSKKKKPTIRPGSSSLKSTYNEKASSFKMTIDLRGKKADEAMTLLQKYIDDAILLSMREVSVLHGKGDGILRRLTREYLSGHEEVESYRDAHVEKGGSGITRVFFKSGS